MFTACSSFKSLTMPDSVDVKNHNTPSSSAACVSIGRLRSAPSGVTVVTMATEISLMSSRK
jgi:hypothetical protein